MQEIAGANQVWGVLPPPTTARMPGAQAAGILARGMSLRRVGTAVNVGVAEVRILAVLLRSRLRSGRTILERLPPSVDCRAVGGVPSVVPDRGPVVPGRGGVHIVT